MQPTDESIEEIKKIYSLPNIEINGIFTHFACADEEDKTSATIRRKSTLILSESSIKPELRYR